MTKIIHKPMRMCISCRNRDTQQNLLRLQYIDGNLESFKKSGRSFYICKTCLTDEKRLPKTLMRQCRSGEKDKLMNRLKEIITDDRKS